MKIIHLTAFIIFFIFGFVGLFFSGNLIHEMSHEYDLRSLSQNGSICLLEWNSPDIARFSFSVKEGDEQKVENIRTFSESKAITLDIILGLVFTVSLFIVLTKYFPRN